MDLVIGDNHNSRLCWYQYTLCTHFAITFGTWSMVKVDMVFVEPVFGGVESYPAPVSRLYCQTTNLQNRGAHGSQSMY